MLDNNEENVEKNEVIAEEKVNEVSPETEEIIEEAVVTVDETTKAVDEIEKSVAEKAEKSEAKEEETPVVDYSVSTLEELVSTLEKTIANNAVQKIKSQVDAVKNAFNQKFGALLAEKKAAFLEEGGNSIDFQFSSPLKSEYNKLLSEYKKQRDGYYNNLERQLKENLEKRILAL